MERQHRQRVLRRIADDLRLGRLGRQREFALTVAADGCGGDRLPTVGLLGGMVAGTVACQFTKLLGLPLAGPAKVW